MDRNNLDTFTRQYIETALWSSLDDNNNPLDAKYSISDISDECLKKMIEDCELFQEKNEEWITEEHLLKDDDPSSQAGHDFWLTRNGHGAGFWCGQWSDEADQAMTKYSEDCKEVDLYVGDDRIIYC